MENIRKSATTQQISDADTTRDITLKGLIETIATAQKHFSATVRESARKLQILVGTYGKISALPYNEETAKIYNLVEEMKKEYATDIANLNIGDWVQELESNNKAFETLFNQRYDEQLSKTTTNAREIRSQIDADYKALCETIEAYSIVTPNADYDQFIQELNLRIDYYNLTIAQRQGRAVAKKNNEGNSEEVKG